MSFSAVSQISDALVKTGVFYPDLSTKKMAIETRLDGTVSTERLKTTMRFASLKIERELKKWILPRMAYGTLAEYDRQHLTDQCVLYEMAVFFEARALIIEQYRDYDSTPDTTKRVNEVTPTIDDCRRNVRNAIEMFFDEGNDDTNTDAGFMTVDLI